MSLSDPQYQTNDADGDKTDTKGQRSFRSTWLSILGWACLSFIGACSQEQPSEASRWEALLVESGESTRNDWQIPYVRFRDNQSDEDAAESVREHCRNHPNDPNVQMAAAIVERDSQRFDEAEALFLKVVEQNPQRSGALWNLGRLELRKGNTEKAARFFVLSQEGDPSAWQPIYALSQLRRQQGKVSEAEELWRKAKMLGAGRTSQRGGMGENHIDVVNLLSEMEWD